MSCNESQRNHSSAGNQPKCNDPLIADRIAVWPHEQNRQHQVRECKPVCAIRQKWIARICVGEPMVHARDPRQQMTRLRDPLRARTLQRRQKPMYLGLQRKRSNAAEHETGHEEGQPETNRPAVVAIRQKSALPSGTSGTPHRNRYSPSPCIGGGGATTSFIICAPPLYQSTFRVTTITAANTANNISDPRISALSSLISSP